MSEKSEVSDVPSVGSGMKVNVMYRGIVYRVRGIKVLCSVVSAVILLLVAIVGLGVWMLVSAYAEEKVDPFGGDFNGTAPRLTQIEKGKGTDQPTSTPSTIDFNAPSVTLREMSIAARVPITPSNEDPVNEAVGHFQGVTPVKDLVATSRYPGPDPNFGLFGGLPEQEHAYSEGTTSAADANSEPWHPMAEPDDYDSQVGLSENRPVVVPSPSDDYSEYSDRIPDYVPNNNRRVIDDYPGENLPKYPLHGGLPDKIPRDIDPALLDMGLPFPYPPSLPTIGPPKTPINPRFPGGPQRVPPGIRRGQNPTRSPYSRQPYQRRPTYDRPPLYDYDDPPDSDRPHPYANDEEPTFISSQPYDHDDQPPYDRPQPYANDAQPAYDRSQSNGHDDQLPHDRPHPYTNDEQPAYDRPQPYANNEQPAYDRPQPYANNEQPAYDRPQPYANNEQPTYDRPQIYKQDDQPDYSQPTYDRPQPNDYDDQLNDYYDQPTYDRAPYDQDEQPPYDGPQHDKPAYDKDQLQNESQRVYDHYFTPSLQDTRKLYQPSTLPEVLTVTFEQSDSSPGIAGHEDFQQRTPNRGGQTSGGFTLPPSFKMPQGITLPPGMTLPKDVTIPNNLKRFHESAGGGPIRRRPGPAGFIDDMLFYYNNHERPTSTLPPASETQYSQRKGLTQEEEEEEEEEDTRHSYTRPKVVGSDDRIHTNGRRPVDPAFKHFQDVYNNDGKAPAIHDDRGPAPGESPPRWRPSPPRRPPPHFSGPPPGIRGPRPNGQGYPLPIRPDAERPPVQIPNRKLLVEPNHRPPAQTAPRPDHSATTNHRPLLGPLYDIYEYSQRLASTLLTFPSHTDNRYNESREEYMQKEVELLEDYNKVFKQPNTTSADVLPDMFDDRPSRNERLMLLDSEKLRSLTPFELSLITWTFLDFWEFLIEKVGTLSKQDLHLLETRLERLRQNKDRVLTKNFMTATVNQVSQDTDRSLPDISEAIAMAHHLLETLPHVEEVEGVNSTASHDQVEGRMWNPLGMFSSDERVKFMEFAIKVLFKFGRVYLTKNYALDCMMLLFCKDLNANSKKDGMDGMAAKIKR
ncbi:hypothetical protein Hamer_G004877 [Homarus americanus]|uniref:Uncharacterized protein n=1 Tax=Homarus americanus TaxID=6706 RepID=A0A8J5MV43_HOMAM|nr:hypothetical protein Hamer_G004877 [Homarus americanus]